MVLCETVSVQSVGDCGDKAYVKLRETGLCETVGTGLPEPYHTVEMDLCSAI